MQKYCLAYLSYACASALFLTATEAYAVDHNYDPMLPLCDDLFSDPNCWTDGVAPGVGDNAIFNNMAVAPYTVNFNAPARADNAVINTDTLVWDLGGNTFNITTDLTVGKFTGDIGNLTIRNGAVSDQTGYIALDRMSTGTVVVDGPDTIWNNDTLEIGVLRDAKGTLIVQNGGSVTSNGCLLGSSPRSAGTVNVDGIGSTWNSGRLYIGYSPTFDGEGYLNITNEGTVQSTDVVLSQYEDLGVATVDGAGSRWNISNRFVIGEDRWGIVKILNGGTIESSGSVTMGHRTGASGTVTVDGAGSSWTNNGPIIVGGWSTYDGPTSSGEGYITINNGGYVSNTDAYLGKSGSIGTVTVNGSKSRWDNSGNIYIGDYGPGRLYIQNGAIVSNVNGYLGRFVGLYEDGVSEAVGSGTVVVDGINSTWNNEGSLYVGGDETSAGGTGSVIASNSSIVNVGNVLKVWRTGSVNISDSTLNTSTIVNAGNINIGSGKSDVYGNVQNAGVINVYGNGTATFHGDIHDYSNIDVAYGSSAVFMGNVSMGCKFLGAGSLYFNGSVTTSTYCNQPIEVGGDMTLGVNSRTIMEIGGTSPLYGYDPIDVAGTLQLHSELDVLLKSYFDVSPGDSFDLFTANNITGNFNALFLPDLGNDQTWQLDILHNVIGTTDVVRLSVISEVPAPPAVWLFSSGILGLIRIARRKIAA